MKSEQSQLLPTTKTEKALPTPPVKQLHPPNPLPTLNPQKKSCATPKTPNTTRKKFVAAKRYFERLEKQHQPQPSKLLNEHQQHAEHQALHHQRDHPRPEPTPEPSEATEVIGTPSKKRKLENNFPKVPNLVEKWGGGKNSCFKFQTGENNEVSKSDKENSKTSQYKNQFLED